MDRDDVSDRTASGIGCRRLDVRQAVPQEDGTYLITGEKIFHYVW